MPSASPSPLSTPTPTQLTQVCPAPRTAHRRGTPEVHQRCTRARGSRRLTCQAQLKPPLLSSFLPPCLQGFSPLFPLGLPLLFPLVLWCSGHMVGDQHTLLRAPQTKTL